nr:fumarylacetoacetate hydrolase family protein [Chitinophaga sedimenti]
MKIICVGRNYAKHAEELKNEVPSEPVIFMKPKNALLQNNHPFYYPEFTDNLHFECELVLRVSKTVNISRRSLRPVTTMRFL